MYDNVLSHPALTLGSNATGTIGLPRRALLDLTQQTVFVSSLIHEGIVPKFGVALTVLTLQSGFAATQTPFESDRLEGYLEQHCAAPRLPHCDRHDRPTFTPNGPVVLFGGGTNATLRERKEWHSGVHGALGSDMAVGQGPRGPIFLAYHRFLDDVALGFDLQCLELESDAQNDGGSAFRILP